MMTTELPPPLLWQVEPIPSHLPRGIAIGVAERAALEALTTKAATAGLVILTHTAELALQDAQDVLIVTAETALPNIP